MLFKRRILAGALVAVFALGAITAANASATEFVFSKTGALKGSALTAQKFTTAVGSWSCSKSKMSGNVTTLKTAVQKVTVQFEGCVLLGSFGLAVSPAEYELNANGSFKLLKEFTMSTAGEECLLGFPAQAGSIFKYANKPAGKLEIESAITKMVSWGGGVACSYSEESRGTLAGKALLELEGGTVEVK
jgi:hypothetical protein